MIDLILGAVIIYMAVKFFIFLWNKVLLPTGKWLSKVIITLATLAFFIALFILRDQIFDLFPKSVQILILGGLGFYFGLKYLKHKR